MDISNSAAALVGIQQAQTQTQIGISAIKHAADMQKVVASELVGAAVDSSVYNGSGRVVTPVGKILVGKG